METRRKKILFVGAGGEVATKVLPTLAGKYNIVGIIRNRAELSKYCVDVYSGDLFTNYAEIFDVVFRAHQFDAIVWNAVRYFSSSFQNSTREGLHAEFDIAVALPLACVKAARKEQNFKGTFSLISSRAGLKFYREDLATYSLVKNAQIKFAELLAQELEGVVAVKVIAPGAVRSIPKDELVRIFAEAIENADPKRMLYIVNNE